RMGMPSAERTFDPAVPAAAAAATTTIIATPNGHMRSLPAGVRAMMPQHLPRALESAVPTMPASCAALLLQATPPDFGRILRADALNLALGILLIGVGLAAVLAYAHPPRRQQPLLWFGLFSVLYGLRLLVKT